MRGAVDKSSGIAVGGSLDGPAQSGSGGNNAGIGVCVSLWGVHEVQSWASAVMVTSRWHGFDRRLGSSSSVKAELPEPGGVVATGETEPRFRDSGVIGKSANGGLFA